MKRGLITGFVIIGILVIGYLMFRCNPRHVIADENDERYEVQSQYRDSLKQVVNLEMEQRLKEENDHFERELDGLSPHDPHPQGEALWEELTDLMVIYSNADDDAQKEISQRIQRLILQLERMDL